MLFLFNKTASTTTTAAAVAAITTTTTTTTREKLMHTELKFRLRVANLTSKFHREFMSPALFLFELLKMGKLTEDHWSYITYLSIEAGNQ